MRSVSVLFNSAGDSASAGVPSAYVLVDLIVTNAEKAGTPALPRNASNTDLNRSGPQNILVLFLFPALPRFPSFCSPQRTPSNLHIIILLFSAAGIRNELEGRTGQTVCGLGDVMGPAEHKTIIAGR